MTARTIASLAALALAPAAAGRDLSLDEYRGELTAIRDALREGDVAAARDRARALREARVRAGRDSFAADRTVLDPIAASNSPEDARASLGRLDRVLEEIDSTARNRRPPPPPDPALLDRVRDRQASSDPLEGGPVDGLPEGGVAPEEIGFFERVGRWLGGAGDWILDEFRAFREWLKDLWPDEAASTGGAGGLAAAKVLVAILLVAVIAGLGILVWRVLATRERDAKVASAPAGAARPRPRQDDDPLSRSVGEWERYALELSAQGRYREAARAWYHAVLATLQQSGLLHQRRGRTNWEYVSALETAFAERPAFVEITRLFDRAWYGHEDPGPEDLDTFASRARNILDALARRRGP